MRSLKVSLLAFALLAGCQTASYKQTSALAGTSWRASDVGTDPHASFFELQFGSKLAPSGLGQVKVAPGNGNIVLFQVIDEKLLIRVDGVNQPFDFDIDGNALTLTHLSATGEKLGIQHFTKD
jgi:hypothetical protein